MMQSHCDPRPDEVCAIEHNRAELNQYFRSLSSHIRTVRRTNQRRGTKLRGGRRSGSSLNDLGRGVDLWPASRIFRCDIASKVTAVPGSASVDAAAQTYLGDNAARALHATADGNCFFHSISILLFGSEAWSFHLRVFTATVGIALSTEWWARMLTRHFTVTNTRSTTRSQLT